MKQPFERVVAEHGPAVFRVCRSILDPQDSQDAWSETFLAALKVYPDLPADAKVEAWLVTIARRKAIDVTRTNARRPIAVESPPEPRGHHEHTDDGELWGAVGALPERQREAVAYHYLVGLPYREIAALTASTTDAVRRAAADGIASLRRAQVTDSTEGARP